MVARLGRTSHHGRQHSVRATSFFSKSWDRTATSASGIQGRAFRQDITSRSSFRSARLIYIFGIALVRIANKRFLGKFAAFDTVLAIVIGSLLSRAVTDTDYFLQVLAACLMLVLLHRVFSLAAANSDRFGNWIKGHDRLIIKDGELLRPAMKKSNLSEHDVMQSLRLGANIEDVSKIKKAQLEKNGDISVILKNDSNDL